MLVIIRSKDITKIGNAIGNRSNTDNMLPINTQTKEDSIEIKDAFSIFPYLKV